MSVHIPSVPAPLSGQPHSENWNLYDRLLQERLIFLGQTLNSACANQTIAAMLYLDTEATNRDIRLYINTSGDLGSESLTAGLAIYDTMRCLRSDVITVCTGVATGVATFLVALGTAEKRLALPHARLRLSQPDQIISERAVTEIDIAAQELLRQRQMLAEVLARHTGQSVETILADTERGTYLSPEAALEYGLIDTVVLR